MNPTYGTAFEELSDDEKTAIKKRPKAVHDEIVTDEKGRRRFHGAFTGGFSAGYFNTVGTKHGWVPQTFVSSRGDRAKRQQTNAEDYMDDEDLGEFGIAAKKIRTKSDFMQSLALPGESTKLAWERSEGTSSVANESITQRIVEMLQPVNNSIGINLLKQMGWRPGKGIGPKMSKRMIERQKVRERPLEGSKEIDEEYVNEVEEFARGSEFSPDDIAIVSFKPKDNLHGLGYSGIKETSVLSQSYGTMVSSLKTGKKSKGIRGQAFGVGVYEDDDEDIFTNYDLSQYDFEIGNSASQIYEVPKFDSTFTPSTKNVESRKYFGAPMPPHNFHPSHKSKGIELKKELPEALLNARDKMTPIQRAIFLGIRDSSVMGLLSEKDREFLRNVKKEAKTREENRSIKSEPFEEEPLKAHRFKKYVHYLKRGIPFPQPIELTRLEWEEEEKDFQNALTPDLRNLLPETAKRLQPLANLEITRPIAESLKQRFQKEKGENIPSSDSTKEHARLEAVKERKFGELTRTKYEWHPARELCKRFNVPNPYPESQLVGALGLSKKIKGASDYSLFDLGLPNTGNELVRKNPSRFDVKTEPVTEEIIEVKQTDKAGESAPVDFLKALFEESESSDNELDDDIYKRKLTEKLKRTAQTQQNIVPRPVPTLKKEVIKEKVITVLDIVTDDYYGPALPPPDTLQAGIIKTENSNGLYRGSTESISSDSHTSESKNRKKKRHKHKKHKKKNEKEKRKRK